MKKLDEEEDRAVSEGLNEESLVVYDMIKKDGLSKDEIKKIKQVSVELLESIKEHLFLLKRMQEENYKSDSNFFNIENKYLSYLHRIEFGEQSLYISALIDQHQKELLLDNFADFIEDINKILSTLLS